MDRRVELGLVFLKQFGSVGFFKKNSHEDMLIDFREREGGKREKERNTDLTEKHRSVASCTCPNLGLNPQSRHVPLPGTRPVSFWLMGLCYNQLSHTGQGWLSGI